jgi:hypothetical protein
MEILTIVTIVGNIPIIKIVAILTIHLIVTIINMVIVMIILLMLTIASILIIITIVTIPIIAWNNSCNIEEAVCRVIANWFPYQHRFIASDKTARSYLKQLSNTRAKGAAEWNWPGGTDEEKQACIATLRCELVLLVRLS